MSDDWRLESFFHTIINARDIDETVTFYKELGLEVIRDGRDMKWPEGGMTIFGLTPHAKGKGGTLMGLPNQPPPQGIMLDIYEWTEPHADFPTPSSTTIPRVIAFRAKNVAAAMKALQAKGYRTTMPEPYTALAHAGIRAVGCVYDPNGNIVLMAEHDPGLKYSRVKEVYGTESA